MSPDGTSAFDAPAPAGSGYNDPAAGGYGDPFGQPEAAPPVNRYKRYQHLRANVARRRALYGVFILLAIVVFVASLMDIMFLESKMQYGVYGAYGLLFVIGVILLISRKRSEAEIAQLAALEKALLSCPQCKSIFQFGEVHFSGRKKISFSCPVCGTYSALPDAESEPVRAPPPTGELREVTYQCEHCLERITVGVFGEQELHESRFRACPNCGEKDFVKVSQGPTTAAQPF
ncbi:MAG TPA: hypothetical protein VI796_04345 [Candidatus Thermoplasmatota archaeon]|nr:hypothetical protein [Candidatus Thermoplasmatota archaeon]